MNVWNTPVLLLTSWITVMFSIVLLSGKFFSIRLISSSFVNPRCEYLSMHPSCHVKSSIVTTSVCLICLVLCFCVLFLCSVWFVEIIIYQCTLIVYGNNKQMYIDIFRNYVHWYCIVKYVTILHGGKGGAFHGWKKRIQNYRITT